MLRHSIPDLDLRTKLEERGWECHLLLQADGQTNFAFKYDLCCELGDLLEAVFQRDVTFEDVKHEWWGVVIGPPSGEPVACATLSFKSDVVSSFMTRFEAVHPSVQKTGVGRLLFDCLAVWARFLAFNDESARECVGITKGQFFLVACIDADDAEDVDEEDCKEAWEDNVYGHGKFLKKLGFIKAQHAFGQVVKEIAFQREFNVPTQEEEA